jgi:putative ABC transport system ATP-binding protein
MHKWLIWSVVLVAVVAVVLRATVFAPDPIRVSVVPVERARVEATVTNTKAGTVRARRRAQLSPEIGGRIVEIAHREGDEVESGALLIRLNDATHEAQIRLAQEALRVAQASRRQACIVRNRAQRELERNRALADKAIVSADVLDRLESAYETANASCSAVSAEVDRAKAQIAAAQVELKKTAIRAPFKGVIAEVRVEVGEWVTPSPPLLKAPAVIDVIDPSSTYISAPMDEVDSASIHAGQHARGRDRRSKAGCDSPARDLGRRRGGAPGPRRRAAGPHLGPARGQSRPRAGRRHTRRARRPGGSQELGLRRDPGGARGAGPSRDLPGPRRGAGRRARGGGGDGVPSVIELEGVYRTYTMGEQSLNALDGVSEVIESGEYLAVMGPSGSGKSTLLNILGCLDRPTRGVYRLEGQDVGALSDEELSSIRRHKIGFVFQRFHLIPRLDAAENVGFPMVFAGVPRAARRERVALALDAVGLGPRAEHRPGELSGGELQRVAIARATVMRPRVLLADEPTGNLDTASGRQVMDLLGSLNADGLTLVVVTHDPNVARRANRTLLMQDGRIAQRLSSADLAEALPLAPPEEPAP